MTSSGPPLEQLRPRVLVVDDDDDFRSVLVRLLSEAERCIDEASSAGEARRRLEQQRYDVVITDLSMPEEGGLSLMQWSQRHWPGPLWIVLTGHGTLDAAVTALQLGAYDFLEKPLLGSEPVRNAVRNALAQQSLRLERDRLHDALGESNVRLRKHVEELQQAHQVVQEQANDIRADLHRAGMIQRALLPQTVPPLTRFHVDALYRPSHSIGGDLYDVVALDDRHSVLLIADAAGHGLSAALLAVLFRSRVTFVDPDSRAPLPPCEALRRANRALCEGFPASGLFLTGAYCLLDTEKGRATVASAGHPPLVLLRRRGEVERIFHTGPALGLYPEADYSQQEVLLEPGDRLLFYSDGLYEWLPGADESSSGKIPEALGAASAGPEVFRYLVPDPESLDLRGGDAPEDDVTLLLLSATPGTSRLDNGTLQPWPVERPGPSRFEILVGSDAERLILSIAGRAGWARSAAFHAECVAALEVGHGVVIDLALCQSLDSTFLGTLHDLAERAEQANREFRLQGVTPPVEALFSELGMKRVMERIVPRMLPLPTRMKALAGATDSGALALHTLRAHERLAALSDRARQEFDPLLTQLRREVAAASR